MDPTSFLRRIALLLICVSLLSCGGSKADTTPGGQAPQSEVAPKGVERLPDRALPSEFSQQKSIFQNAPALRYLPSTTLALALSDSAIQLGQTLESTPILNSYPDGRKVLATLRTDSGAGLFFPETWELAGIDADAQAGAAISILDNRLVRYFFVTIKSKEVVLETLKTISSSNQLVIENIGQDGDGEFFASWEGEYSTAVAVRGNTLYFIVADRKKAMQATRKYYQHASASESLAAALDNGEFRNFDFGAKLTGIVNFPALTSALAQDVDDLQYVSERVERLEESVAAAIDEGREEDATRAKEELEREMTWYRKRQLNQAGEELTIRRYLSPLGVSPIGVTLDGGTTRLRAQIKPSPQSELASLFTANTSAFALPSRLGADPIFMVAGHFRTSKLLTMIEPIFYFQATTLKQFKNEIKNFSQVDFDTVISNFDGEISGALTLDIEAKQANQPLPFGMHLLAHLRDPAAMQLILDDLATREKIGPYAKSIEGKTVLDIPGPFDSALIRVRVDGEYLEARSLQDRVSTVTWKKAELDILTQPDNRAIMVLDPALFGFILMVGDSHYDMAEDLTPSPTVAAKIKELQEKEEKLRQTLHAAVFKRITLTSDNFGRFVVSAQNKDGGYAVLGGLFGQSANLGRGIQTLIEAMAPELEHMRTKKTPEVRTLRRQLDRIQQDLSRLESISAYR